MVNSAPLEIYWPIFTVATPLYGWNKAAISAFHTATKNVGLEGYVVYSAIPEGPVNSIPG